MTEMDRIVGGAQNRLESLHTASDALDTIRVETTSPDGLVTVTVDGSGGLVHLVLADDLSSTTARHLETCIVSTAAAAAQDALALREGVLQRLQTSFTDT